MIVCGSGGTIKVDPQIQEAYAMTSTAPLPPLRRALLHPLWLGAVATLAVNDHLLKGSGLAPGWLTGKLSDVVGLFAAPLLLAVLLRVSARRGWAVAHLAIGTVFAAIQLSPAAANAWSGLMGLVGVPWTITSDPTDLLTLPMLAASYAYVPRLARSRVRARHVGETAVAGAGLVACVATSPGPTEPFYGSFETDTYLHNANDYDIVLRIRPLQDTVELDCDVVEEDPAGYLREALFGDAQSWTLAPDATMQIVDLWDRPPAPCNAAWIDADNLSPSIVFWREGQFPTQWVEGTGITPDSTGWISVQFDDEGRGRYETEADLVFDIEPLAPLEPGACTPTGPETRLAWGSIPAGQWRLGEVDEGLDGCVQLSLLTGFEDDLEQPGRPWEMCLPRGLFPFADGDTIELREGSASDAETVEIVTVDPMTGAEDEQGPALIAVAGAASSTLFGMQPLVDPTFDCDPVAEETCGTVRRVATVSMVGGGYPSVALSTEASVATRSESHSLDVALVHASERVVFNTACEDTTGAREMDIELVAVRRAL